MGQGCASEKKTIAETIAGWKAVINNLPEVERNETLLKLLSSKTPLEFLLGFCEILGLSYDEILAFFSRLLTGINEWAENVKDNVGDAINTKKIGYERKVDNGILHGIEAAIKVILITNFKNMYTCSINPIIPFNLLKSPNGWSPKPGSIGIKVPVSSIDLYNVLQYSPKDDGFGSNLYFDNNLPSNELWKSIDFNCFMWYVINKSSTLNNEKLKLVWDNRVKYFRTRISKKRQEKLDYNNSIDVFKTNFFDEFRGNGTLINTTTTQTPYSVYTANEKKKNKETYKSNKKNGNFKEKKAYLILEYNEIDETSPAVDTLTMFINADRYLYNIGKDEEGTEIYYPKTVFEFNYDYINSLKLFDGDIILSNIHNAMFGLVAPTVDAITDVKYSMQMEAVAAKVADIITKVMESEDTIINDDFFTFSNDEYDKLLNDTELKYSENYVFGDTSGTITEDDINSITNKILDIGNSANIVEQETKIKNTFLDITVNGSEEGYNKITGQISWNGNPLNDGNIIWDLIKETVKQIVLQVFSPKVMLLYVINKYFMGDIADGDFRKLDVKELFKSLHNLIITIVKQILDVIIKQFLSYILNELKELINLVIRKILLERIEYYLEILRGMLSLIKMFYNSFSNVGKGNSSIENVNYADIQIQTENNPA